MDDIKGSLNTLMFNRIAPKYDLLNRLLSFRRDIAWRKQVLQAIPREQVGIILDLACGTGDLSLALKAKFKNSEVIGIDPAEKMLKAARDKACDKNILFQLGDAQALKFQTASIDTVTMAFGIRNVENPELAISEMYRVLRPRGHAVILEFSLPKNRVVRGLYLWYFRHVLPAVGGLISGDYKAYKYLNESVEKFPHGANFANLLRAAGFDEVCIKPQTFGIASIYVGTKK